MSVLNEKCSQTRENGKHTWSSCVPWFVSMLISRHGTPVNVQNNKGTDCCCSFATEETEAHRVIKVRHTKYRISKQSFQICLQIDLCLQPCFCLPPRPPPRAVLFYAGHVRVGSDDWQVCSVWPTEWDFWWNEATGKTINAQLFLLLKLLDKMWGLEITSKERTDSSNACLLYWELGLSKKQWIPDLKISVLSLKLGFSVCILILFFISFLSSLISFTSLLPAYLPTFLLSFLKGNT